MASSADMGGPGQRGDPRHPRDGRTRRGPGPHRRRHAPQRRSDHRRGRPARSRPARVQDGRRRHALPGVGQGRHRASHARGRSGDRGRQPDPGQPRPGGEPDAHGRRRGRERLRRHGGGHHHPADRQQLLEQARWQHRRRLQLHALERRRPAQRQLGHVLSHPRGARPPGRLPQPDAQGRRLRARRSRLGRSLVPALPVAALVHLDGGPVRDQQEPRPGAAIAGRRGDRAASRQQQSRAARARRRTRVQRRAGRRRRTDPERRGAHRAPGVVLHLRSAEDEPRHQPGVLPEPERPGPAAAAARRGRQARALEGLLPRPHPVHHLRQPAAQSVRGYERRRRRGVDRLDY